jgi:hypothetical protein
VRDGSSNNLDNMHNMMQNPKIKKKTAVLMQCPASQTIHMTASHIWASPFLFPDLSTPENKCAVENVLPEAVNLHER